MPEETTDPRANQHFTAGLSTEDTDATGAAIQDDISEGDVSSGAEKKLLTQEEHERSLKRRLARQERKLREELQAEAQEEARKSRMDEVQRLAVERDEAIQSSKATVQKANERTVLAEAKAQAAAMGVPQDSLKYISRLVDISDVDVDSDGTPDEEAIREAVEQVIKDVPALAQREDIPTVEEQDPRSPVMPVGRDRSPDASRSSGNSQNPDLLQVFNQRLRQRTGQR